MLEFENDLHDVLNEENGIAICCLLISCPNCNKDVWVNIGHHCGYDAVLEGDINTNCYLCDKQINTAVDFGKAKKAKFMTTDEYSKMITMENKIPENELTLKERFEWLKNNKPEGYNEIFDVTWEQFIEKEVIPDLYSFSFNHPFYGGYSGLTDDEARHIFLDDFGVPRKIKEK